MLLNMNWKLVFEKVPCRTSIKANSLTVIINIKKKEKK